MLGRCIIVSFTFSQTSVSLFRTIANLLYSHSRRSFKIDPLQSAFEDRSKLRDPFRLGRDQHRAVSILLLFYEKDVREAEKEAGGAE